MGDHHQHRSVRDWIHLFEEADETDTLLASCPDARAAWSEGIDPWLEHALGCPTCRAIARVQELWADECLECPVCRDNLELVYRLADEAEHYEPAVVWELERGEQRVDELRELPLCDAVVRVRGEPLYQQWGVVQRLLSAARAHWHRDPARAHRWAVIAVAAAEELDPVSYGAAWIADLRAKAHAYVANAHRIRGQFAEAEAEFALAEACLRRGVGSGLAEARVFTLKASLLKDQHRHRETLALLAEVQRFYEERGERHEVGRLALKRSEVLYSLDQPAEAAEECARAVENLDPQRDPQLPLIARNNAIEYLLSAGALRRARELFEALPSMSEPIAELQRAWVEADLLRAEERYAESRAAYDRVRTGFAEAGLHYDAALASLDLALTAYQEGGRLDEVRHMAERAAVELTLADAKAEAFAAHRLVLQAVREDALNLALLEHVRSRLEALRPS